MRIVTLIVRIAFVTQAHTKEMAANHIKYTDESLDKSVSKLDNGSPDSVHKLVDTLADKLLDRAVLPLHHMALQDTILGKPGHLAMSPSSNLRPLRPNPGFAALHHREATRGHHVESSVRFTSPLGLGKSSSGRSSVAMGAKKADEDLNAEEATKKYGLEVGLFKAFTSKDGEATVKPADLLKRYGAAYLATSISLAIVSYATCYLLISQGVDVSALLLKVGIESTAASSTAGTAAIAYAVHKAASPIRFPPTVALTPVVANWMGKKIEGDE